MTATLKVLCLSLFVAVASSAAVAVPSSWTICKKSDPNLNQCLKSTIQNILVGFKSGDPSIGVPSLDPMIIDEIAIKQGNGQSVSLDLSFKNLNIYGLSKMIIDNVDAQLDKDLLNVDFHIEGSNYKVTGDYTSKGKILVVPINGGGKSELIFDNLKGRMALKFKKVKKGDETYYTNEKTDYTIDTTRLHLNFKRTVNADDPIAKNLNVFLNENWKEILNDLKPAIAQSFGVATKNFANKIFSKIPLSKLLPE